MFEASKNAYDNFVEKGTPIWGRDGLNTKQQLNYFNGWQKENLNLEGLLFFP